MARDWMQYDRQVQSALKGVVRQVLRRIQAQGLPGDHHVYVVFRSTHPGVVMPAFLREKYPDEMTIVLQHQFWGLEVFEDKFRIGLSFNKSPQELTIPFAAMKGFFDPSVQFGLQFDIEDLEAAPEMRQPVPVVPVHVLEAAVEGQGDDVADGAVASPPAADDTKDPRGEVVSLDAFRKK